MWDECYHLAGTLFHIIWNIVPDELEHYSSLSKTICFVQNLIVKTGETEDGEQEKTNGLHCEFYRHSARRKSQKSPKNVDRKGNRQQTTSDLDQFAFPKEAVLSSKTAKNTD